jgi:enoyl-CoA hydratase/carnithine racemase
MTATFEAGPTIEFEVRDRVCWVSMERPEAKNALSFQLKADLISALEEYERRDDLVALVLSGSDCGAFSAGGDLKEVARRQSGEDGRQSPDLFAALLACQKPLIAAVDGHAVGGGFEMTMVCDVRIATRRSSFGMPEPRRGMMGDFGLDNLCRMMPLGEALRIQLTGASIDADRAYQIGFLQEVVEDRPSLFEAADAMAADIGLCSPSAVRTIKHIVKTGRNVPIEYARAISRPYREAVFASADAQEGSRAFAEKRAPRWTRS